MQIRKVLQSVGLLLTILFSLPSMATVDSVNVAEQPDKGTLYPVGSNFVSGQQNGKKFISTTNDIQESLKATQNPNHLEATGGNSPTSFSYGRGVGTIPTSCPSGWSQSAGLCQKDCPAGYSSVAGVCWQQCPTNYTDMGATCTWWKLWPHTFAKNSWVQERSLRQCAVGAESDAGLCYTQCAIGYNGVGPVCWSTIEHFVTSQQSVRDQATDQQNAYQKPAGINIPAGQAPVLKTDLQFAHIVCALEESEGAFGLPVPGVPDLVAMGIGAGVGAIKPGAWFDASLSDTVALNFEGGATCEDDGAVATASLNFHPSITVQASTRQFDPALHNLAGVDLGIAKVSVYELIPFRIYGAVGTTLGVDTTISSTIDRREPGFFIEGKQYATSSKLEVTPEVDFWISLETYLRVTTIVSFIPDLVQLGAEFKLFVLELDLPYVLEEGVRTVNGTTELFNTESLNLNLEAGRGYVNTFLRVLGIEVDVFPPEADLAWSGHKETHELLSRNNVQVIETSASTYVAPVADVNLALGKAAAQSSEGWGGAASRAVDGNANGDWSAASVTHTLNDNQAWWQVDLGASSSVTSVKLSKRTDCCNDRLSNFYVLVSEQPFANSSLTDLLNNPAVSSQYHTGVADAVENFSIGKNARYVRVQLTGQNYLSLAEVEVMGAPN